MKEMTLKELAAQIEEIEKRIAEPPEVTQKIEDMARFLADMVSREDIHKVKNLSDYDMDGINSAKIIATITNLLNPDVEVEVCINDRRGSYGVQADVTREDNTAYIISDMGCNQCPEIYEKLHHNDNIAIIDHHLITNENIIEPYNTAAMEAFQTMPNLLNTHCFTCKDGKSSEYCATGLAYRVYQTCKELHEKGEPGFEHFEPDAMIDNTMAVCAMIGTVADMMNVLDEHSYNRQIIRNGLEILNDEKKGLDPYLESFIFASKIFESQFQTKDPIMATSDDIGMKVAPIGNCGGRLSPLLDLNGAQIFYDALSGKNGKENPDNADKDHIVIYSFAYMNETRKDIVNSIYKNPDIRVQAKEQSDKENELLIVKIPETCAGASHTMCGLIAGKLCEEYDKPCIVLVKNENGTYSGSARNSGNAETGIKSAFDVLVKLAEADGIPSEDFRYGGHDKAFGIGSITEKAIDKVMELADVTRDLIQYKDADDYIVITDNPLTLDTKEAADIMKRIEPTGQGNPAPCILFYGQDVRKESIRNHADEDRWKTMKSKVLNESTNRMKEISYNTFSYDEKQFPVSKSDGRTPCYGKISLNRTSTKCSITGERIPAGVMKEVLAELGGENNVTYNVPDKEKQTRGRGTSSPVPVKSKNPLITDTEANDPKFQKLWKIGEKFFYPIEKD